MSEVTQTEEVGQKYRVKGMGLSKSFGHVRALQNVDIQINLGEVLAIVGDNGAGKTTLIKILCGVHHPDKGEVEIDGRIVRITSPKEACTLGIATVFQDLALVDSRDVASNVFLGHEPTRLKFFVDRAKMIEQSQAVLNKLRINIPSLFEEVGKLSGGQRGAIAVGRALSRKSHTVIMDEPTAALGVEETRQVLGVIHQLRDEGMGVVVIAHNLFHVFSIADRIMVLRHGRSVGTKEKSQTTIEEIEKMIIGE
jgi:ABC-type sugar transport system ATPase subunit